jgi:hypothetical protein
MRLIYCIALEDRKGVGGATGVNWYRTKEARDAALGTTGAAEEVPFTFDLHEETDDPEPSDDDITDIADSIAWEMDYTPEDAAAGKPRPNAG